MTREYFKVRLSKLIIETQGAEVLDLRAGRAPYDTREDLAIFAIDELDEAYDFVKGREEWYVDIYVNFKDSAHYTGITLASWD